MIVYAIDDEIAALGLLEEAIEKAIPGQEVQTFASTKELLKAAKDEAPDVVFMDIEMPGMTGLELAKKLQKIKEDVNLIFVTGYSEYALDALKQYASDYLLKPVNAKMVKTAMENLRYPITSKKDIRIYTFGNFTIFYKEKPVVFRMEKSKELLAILIDRNGASITRKEAAAILYEESNFDRNEQKALSRIATWLKEDLEAAGIHDFFQNDNGNYRVEPSMADCDLYEYFAGNKDLYHGEFMTQYSWGEYAENLI